MTASIISLCLTGFFSPSYLRLDWISQNGTLGDNWKRHLSQAGCPNQVSIQRRKAASSLVATDHIAVRFSSRLPLIFIFLLSFSLSPPNTYNLPLYDTAQKHLQCKSMSHQGYQLTITQYSKYSFTADSMLTGPYCHH